MPFRKGQSGNPKGRPRNSSTSLRAKVKQLLDDSFDQIAEDLLKLDPKDRVTQWVKLLEFVVAKRRENQNIDVSRLSEEEVNALIEKAANAISDPNFEDDEEDF